MRRADGRKGAILLEVIVSLTILATAGVAMVTFVSESLRALARAEAADAELARASALLDAVALWPRADLDRHLGTRVQGAWRMRIARPSATLYIVVLTDSLEQWEILRTALYRPEGPHATP
jgi:type II secretory pathway pseudopilin PulG